VKDFTQTSTSVIDLVHIISEHPTCDLQVGDLVALVSANQDDKSITTTPITPKIAENNFGSLYTCFCYPYNNYQIKEPKFLGSHYPLIPLGCIKTRKKYKY
jgi:hypothetical protein